MISTVKQGVFTEILKPSVEGEHLSALRRVQNWIQSKAKNGITDTRVFHLQTLEHIYD